MKLPRDCSAGSLVKALACLGYSPTRQSGSHVRVTTTVGGEHHVTIPSHDPIRLGTLHAVLKDVADHHAITVDDLLQKLGI